MTIVTSVSNLTGDGRDYILAYRRNGLPNGIYNGKVDYFAKTAGIAKKLGIVSGDKLRPNDFIKCSEAVDMLKRAGATAVTSIPTDEELMKYQATRMIVGLL